MSCKHESAEHMMPGESSTPDWCVQVHAEVEQFRCIDCGAWFSLGPSNDKIPRAEQRLADAIVGICLLWEPGRERGQQIDLQADIEGRSP